jgi:hypothetical protein
MKNNNPKQMPFCGIFIFILLSVMPVLAVPVSGSPLPGQTVSRQADHPVSGTVTDETGQPLPGVSIAVKGTATGTITGVDGEYHLTRVPANATLLFSFVGLKAQEIAVNGRSRISVTLEQETIGLDEIVAVGYGTARKKDVTGSVSSVSGKRLAETATFSAAKALQGKRQAWWYSRPMPNRERTLP